MNYQIRHKTHYSYSEPASLSQNELYLRPRATAGQRIVAGRLTITPEPAFLRSRTDYFGNPVDLFMVQAAHRELTILAESRVETQPPPPPAAETTPSWETVAARLAAPADAAELEACQFLYPSPMVPRHAALRDYAAPSFAPGRPILAALLDLTHRIHGEFAYTKGSTTIDTPIEAVLEARQGVCQDFAHLQIGCLRMLGLAARYVSGYLETLPPPGKPKLQGADASHAWLSVFIPGSGWIDLDPTNDLIPGERHVTIAWGRDYGDVPPTRGVVMGGGVHGQRVEVDVMPLPAP